VLLTAVEVLLNRRPMPFGTPVRVSPGLVTTFLANSTGFNAWDRSALTNASLPLIFFSSSMAQISFTSFRSAPVPVTSNGPELESTW
jgi:hypothetical protein